MTDPEVKKFRKPSYDINPLILDRWSPRSFSDYVLSDKELYSLFEAARWAPSAFNNQPWRFIYAKRGSKHWNTLFDLLVDFNKQWCARASVLAVIVSHKLFEHNNKPSRSHQFDTGAAWENLALQATFQGLAVHAMEGFDLETARKNLGIPDEYDVLAMVAIGRKGPKESLPPELQKRETPSDRKPVTEIIMEGRFGNKPDST